MKNRGLRMLSLGLAMVLSFSSINVTAYAEEAVVEECQVATEAAVTEENAVQTATMEEKAEANVEETAENETNADETNADETRADETNTDETSIEETTEDATKEEIEIEDEAEAEEEPELTEDEAELNDATQVVDLNPTDLSKAEVYFENGSEIEYKPTASGKFTPGKVCVSFNDGTIVLTEGADYSVEFTNTTKVGAGKATVKPVGTKYTGSKIINYTIKKTKLSKDSFGLVDASKNAFSLKSCTYNGYPQVQTGFELAYFGGGSITVLVNGRDYKVSYKNNVHAGEAVMTVTGMGNYEGSIEYTYDVDRMYLSSDCFSLAGGKTSFEYTGKVIEPAVKVSYKDSKSATVHTVPSKDLYTYYSSSASAGSKSVYVSVNGQDVCGSSYVYYTVTPKDIHTAKLTFDKTSIEYDGYDALTSVTPKVTCGGKELVQGYDYSIAIDSISNKSTSNGIDAGKVYYSITGAGDYTGTKAEAGVITIKKKKINAYLQDSYFEENGSVPKVKIIYPDGNSGDFTTEYSDANATKAGTYSVTIKAKKPQNYSSALTLKYTIGKNKSLNSDFMILTNRFDNPVYDGTKKFVEVGVSGKGIKLKEGVDYKLSYKNNINAGAAEVVATGIGEYSGQISTTFSIARAGITDADISIGNKKENIELEYSADGKQPKFVIKLNKKILAKDKDYEIKYTYVSTSGSTSYPAQVGAVGTYTATIYGRGNYTGHSSQSLTFKVLPKDLKKCNIRFALSSANYGQIASYVDKHGNFIIAKDGKVELRQSSDYDYSETEKGSKITSTFVGKGNYTGTKTITFTMEKMSVATKKKNTKITELASDNKIYLDDLLWYEFTFEGQKISEEADTYKIKSCVGNMKLDDSYISSYYDDTITIPAGFIGEIEIEGSFTSSFMTMVFGEKKATVKLTVLPAAPTVKATNTPTKTVVVSANAGVSAVQGFEYRYSTKSSMAEAKALGKDAKICAKKVGEYYYVQARSVVSYNDGKSVKTMYSDWSKARGVCVKR